MAMLAAGPDAVARIRRRPWADRQPGVAGADQALSCRRACAPRVRAIMRPPDATVQIAAAASVSDALRQMVRASGRLLVTDGDRVIGLITLSGLRRVIQLKTELEEEEQR
jgi:hypothetical protein